MKRLVLSGLLVFLLSSGAWAQRRGGGGGGFRGGPVGGGRISRGTGNIFPGWNPVPLTARQPFSRGFGSVVFPGGDFAGMRLRGISPGIWSPSYSYWPSTYSSYSSYYGAAPFFGGVAAGSYYGGYPYAAQQPNVIVIGGTPAAEPAAPVVVNQITPMPVARPVMREYAESAPPEPAPPEPAVSEYRSRIYLIALKSGLIQAALAYWVEDGELHYITRDRLHKHITLGSVDRAFSMQLNRERRVPFDLPPG